MPQRNCNSFWKRLKLRGKCPNVIRRSHNPRFRVIPIRTTGQTIKQNQSLPGMPLRLIVCPVPLADCVHFHRVRSRCSIPKWQLSWSCLILTTQRPDTEYGCGITCGIRTVLPGQADPPAPPHEFGGASATTPSPSPLRRHQPPPPFRPHRLPFVHTSLATRAARARRHS